MRANKTVTILMSLAAVTLSACNPHTGETGFQRYERLSAQMERELLLDPILPRKVITFQFYDDTVNPDEDRLMSIFRRITRGRYESCGYNLSDGVVLAQTTDGRMFRLSRAEIHEYKVGRRARSQITGYYLESGWRGKEYLLNLKEDDYPRWLNFDKVICPSDPEYPSAWMKYRFNIES